MLTQGLAILAAALLAAEAPAKPAGGTLSHEAVQGVVKAHLYEIRACFERASLKEPSSTGKVVIEWVVATDGRTRDVRIKSSAAKDPSLATCYADAVKSWRFPKPQGGSVTVTYPFLVCGVGF